MSIYLFTPAPVTPSGASVKVYTDSGCTTLATITSVEGLPIAGSTIPSDGQSGALPHFLGPQTSLWLKVQAPGGATVALTATDSGPASAAAPGTSSPVPPAAFVKVTYDSVGTVTDAQVVPWNDSEVPLASGDPSGLAWLLSRDDYSIYLDIDTPVFVEVYVGTDGTAPVHVQWRGNGPVGAVDVVVPSGVTFNSGRGIIPGCPAGNASGGPASEPGWDAAYVATTAGHTAITYLGVAVYPLP